MLVGSHTRNTLALSPLSWAWRSFNTLAAVFRWLTFYSSPLDKRNLGESVASRKKQVRSKWDTLHPGRALANDLPRNPTSPTELERMIADFFAGRAVPKMTVEQAVIEEGEEEEEE